MYIYEFSSTSVRKLLLSSNLEAVIQEWNNDVAVKSVKVLLSSSLQSAELSGINFYLF